MKIARGGALLAGAFLMLGLVGCDDPPAPGSVVEQPQRTSGATRVKYGEKDSCGPGYRCLMVPNVPVHEEVIDDGATKP